MPQNDGGLHMCCDWSRGERSFHFFFRWEIWRSSDFSL